MNNGPENTKFEAFARDTGAAADGSGPVDPAVDPETSATDEILDLRLEAALRQALRHRDPQAGFADRVLAQATAAATLTEQTPARPLVTKQTAPPAKAKLLHWPQSRLWITGAIAAGLVAGVLEGGMAYRHMREQQRRIVEATQQFQTTERITVRALAQAREQLQKAGVPLTLD